MISRRVKRYFIAYAAKSILDVGVSACCGSDVHGLQYVAMTDFCGFLVLLCRPTLVTGFFPVRHPVRRVFQAGAVSLLLNIVAHGLHHVHLEVPAFICDSVAAAVMIKIWGNTDDDRDQRFDDENDEKIKELCRRVAAVHGERRPIAVPT